ncbi:VirB2 family type IV secretion system major pilin TrwL [Bartonella senegalensis]|uniref:VirB2 family type IV secretion system major pilin TrwL n=1 Tax=Bartonella senegalensis TaxID=1468418 RepID=UPI00055C3C02|nr:VirB2 family type IV secretion system major pilin TrwL [Bartonella senegalensis]
MKQLNNPQSKNKSSTIFATIVTFFMMHSMCCAQAKSLKKAKDALDKFQTELNTIIPVAAAVILLCLAIGYAGRYIGKDTFIRWAIGVIIAGSATQLATMLFTGV